ncbi:hypothetical protein [Mycoplasma putrefaciens]|uniref:Uncharacterized protein n=1 Tax=Mycoplasma putrefaciens (strain ATCC 15718 / NCTC 10155 / C30 KS-1 / KS-1) TaxID=743965 RepID=A0A7U4E9I3_MYCPK|nr:hypothetical protein [Mycoplasma putrefaciens]AEM68959.1 uncharacterized protein MPUT_0619 [Mycoplasma putrefaciens KS1]
MKKNLQRYWQKIIYLFDAKQAYEYNKTFKTSNLIIQISAGVGMLLAWFMFIFGIVGLVVGAERLVSSSIKLNTAAGVSLLILGSYIFLFSALALTLSVISIYFRSTVLKVVLSIVAISSVACMVGGIYLLFVKKIPDSNLTINQVEPDDQDYEDPDYDDDNQDQDYEEQKLAYQRQELERQRQELERQKQAQKQQEQINRARIIEKLKQVQKIYELVQKNEISQERLDLVFAKDEEFKELYEQIKLNHQLKDER